MNSNTQGMERHITQAIRLGADATSFLNLHAWLVFGVSSHKKFGSAKSSHLE
jgi:hypothetical protein